MIVEHSRYVIVAIQKMVTVIHSDEFFQFSDYTYRDAIIESGRGYGFYILVRLISLLLTDIGKDTAETFDIEIEIMLSISIYCYVKNLHHVILINLASLQSFQQFPCIGVKQYQLKQHHAAPNQSYDTNSLYSDNNMIKPSSL